MASRMNEQNHRMKCLFLLVVILTGCGEGTPKLESQKKPKDIVPNGLCIEIENPHNSQQPGHKEGPSVSFKTSCAESLSITAVGDIMFHRWLQRESYKREAGFSPLWENTEKALKNSKITYGNFETQSAPSLDKYGREKKEPGEKFDGRVYTGYPQFNVNPVVLDELKSSGFDIFSTANNHSLDRRGVGHDRTLGEMEKRGIISFGSRKTGESKFRVGKTTVTGKTREWVLAWVGCTYDTNGIPDPAHQIALCFDDEDTVSKTVSKLASDPNIDFVIVAPHWGKEVKIRPSEKQKAYGRKWLDAGAGLILGAHPHVLQPWEKYITKDGREGLILYSMGNFVASMYKGKSGYVGVFTITLGVSPKCLGDFFAAVASAEHNAAWSFIMANCSS